LTTSCFWFLEPVVVLIPTDVARQRALAEVAADRFRQIGLTVRQEPLGWGALTQRRFKTDPVEAGG
jgi:peptide/nickel transport system substrate-binding protein